MALHADQSLNQLRLDPANSGSIESSRRALWARLSNEVQRLESQAFEKRDRHSAEFESISTGCSPMDACLAASGYSPGSIIEYLRTTEGCGATYLAMAAAASALRAAQDKYLVMVDTRHRFYPPALLSHGIDLRQVIWVRPQSMVDAVWATDQALRTASVAAVVADMETLDDRNARRLQLAAQRGGGLGLLLRNLSARRMPSWAEVQWVVRCPARSLDLLPASQTVLRRLEVILARLRGGKAGARLLLDIDSVHGQIRSAPVTKVRMQGSQHRRMPAMNQPAPAQPAGRQVRVS
jgi:protein ImuA